MKLELTPGVYVVAVSGGVDSVVLLDALHRQAQRMNGSLQLIVAHFDHGVRADSDRDRQLVQEYAQKYGHPFVYDRGELGAGVSEEVARQARYDFLHRIQRATKARAIVTAHHQDDVLETAVLNMLRGTGWRGLVSLRSHDTLRRPLLDVPKRRLIFYAQSLGLKWHEDSTNQDMNYLRNYIRHQILPKFSDAQRKVLLTHIQRTHKLRRELETELTNHLHLHPKTDVLDRHWFIMLPHSVAKEVMATWLRRQGKSISNNKLERLVIAGKTYRNNQVTDVDKHHAMRITRDTLALTRRER
jgi:tRNA(Ile)-lysidine synthetase-like protein